MLKRALVVLPFLLVPAAALAAGTTVINNSGLPIDELYAAAPGTTAWGANLLDGVAEGALDSGNSLNIAGLADGTYDLQISAPDEAVLCVMSNVVVKDGKVELTADMGKACK